jgi:hypothetical protein
MADFMSGRFWCVQPYMWRGICQTTCWGPKVGKQLAKAGWNLLTYGDHQVCLSQLRSEMKSHRNDWSHIPILRAYRQAVLNAVPDARSVPLSKDFLFYPHAAQPRVCDATTLTMYLKVSGLGAALVAACEADLLGNHTFPNHFPWISEISRRDQ